MYGNNHILHSSCNMQPLFLYIPQRQAKYSLPYGIVCLCI